MAIPESLAPVPANFTSENFNCLEQKRQLLSFAFMNELAGTCILASGERAAGQGGAKQPIGFSSLVLFAQYGNGLFQHLV